MIELNTKFEASDDVVARTVGGEAVLLNLTSGTYFGLDPVGSRIWELFDSDGATLASVCDALEEEFDVSREQLEIDVRALVDQLLKHNLLSEIA